MKNTKRTVLILVVLSVLIIFSPLFILKGTGAEFGGSDGAGSDVVTELNGGQEPWATPFLESLIGGGLPGEVETLIFCIQTGIGVSIIAFSFGYLVARKKYSGGKE